MMGSSSRAPGRAIPSRGERLVVALTDARGLQWQCGCGTTITLPIDQPVQIPPRCPGCDDALGVSPADETVLREGLQGLQAALRVLRATPGRVTLSLVFLASSTPAPVERPERPTLVYNPTPDCISRLIRRLAP